jgi:cell division protein FtsL
MMDRDVFNFAGVMVVCLATLWGLTVIWTRTRRDLRGQKQPQQLKTDNMDERFLQLQQSVDAIAVEVERIAEGQRFSARLLAESSRPASYSPER